MHKKVTDSVRSYSMPHISQEEATSSREQTPQSSRQKSRQSTDFLRSNLPPAPRLKERSDEGETSRLFGGRSSAPVSARFDSARLSSVLGRSPLDQHQSRSEIGAPESSHASTSSTTDLESGVVGHPAVEHQTGTAPAAAAAADGSGLSASEKRNAGLSSVMQQFLVSGMSWGISRKLFEEFVPAIGQLIGGKTSATAGAAYGQIAGAALGNLLGGVALGATHYMTEHGVKKIRLAIGKGSEYAPKVSGEAMKQAIFIATFTTFMACKSMARSSLPKQKNGEEDAALAYALDIAFSAFGGAAAEGITQSLAKGFGKISANWSWDELKSRVIGGTAAGAASAMGDISTDITKARSDLPGSSLAAAGLGGAMNSVMALGSWFLVRKVMNDYYTARTSHSTAASGATRPEPSRNAEAEAVPINPHAVSPEEIMQLEQFVNSSAPLTTVSESMAAVQMAEQLARE